MHICTNTGKHARKLNNSVKFGPFVLFLIWSVVFCVLILFFDSIDRIFSEFYMDLERPVWDKKAKIRSCKLGLFF